MLSIKTVKNQFSSDPSKNGFSFRSKSLQTLSASDLATEMADYNSTFTKADCQGMLSVLNTVAVKYLAKGYTVELPFCSIRPSVTGTCQNIQDSFLPGTGNNQINYLLSMSDAAKQEVNAKLEYKQITPEAAGNASIYQICTVKADATESTELELSAYDVVRIHGKNLTFDFEDSKQGVILYSENGEYQINRFSRIGSNIIDFTLPADLPVGAYTVTLTTKPGVNRYSDTSSDAIITVS